MSLTQLCFMESVMNALDSFCVKLEVRKPTITEAVQKHTR